MCVFEGVTPSLGALGDLHLLDFQKAQSFVLREDLSGLVAVQVHREAVGAEAKLLADLKGKHQKVRPTLGGSK